MRLKWIRAGVAGILVWLLAACGSSTTAPSAPPATALSAPSPPLGASASVAPSLAPAPSVSASPRVAASPSVAAPVPSVVAAATGAAEHVSTVWVAKVANMAPAWLALDSGYFAQQGLDVDLSYVNGSPAGMAALLSGQADFLEAAGSAVVSAGSQQTGGNAKPVMVIGTVNVAVLKLMVKPSISDPSQLRGATLCVSGPGTLDDLALRLYLPKINLDPATDVSIVAGGSIDGCVAGVIAGQYDGMMVSTPQTVTLQQQGLAALVDLQQQGIPLQELGVSVTQAYAQAHPDTVLHFTRAYIQGIHQWKTDKTFAEQEMTKYLGISDQAQLDDSWQTYQQAFEQVPLPGDQALQNEIDATAAAQGMTPDDFRDVQFVQQLQQNGFIQQVYGS